MLEPLTPLERRVHGRLEEAESVAAVLLGPIEREVGVLHEDIGLAFGRPKRDADTRRGRHLMAVDAIGLAERRADPPRQAHGIVRRLEILGDDGELIAAKPADEIGLAHILAKPRGDLGEQSIAGGVAERVVDRP